MTLPVCLRCSDDGWGTDDGATTFIWTKLMENCVFTETWQATGEL